MGPALYLEDEDEVVDTVIVTVIHGQWPRRVFTDGAVEWRKVRVCGRKSPIPPVEFRGKAPLGCLETKLFRCVHA